ncbi:MAG: DUF362 domain-containing protein [bacterium]|nr:MAG: DUF362 domain-containing protein [bacterium]
MDNKQRVLTRRDFIRGTVGATLGASMLGIQWSDGFGESSRSSLVTIVRDKKAMNDDMVVDQNVLKKMLDQAVIQATGKKNIKDAWLTIVKPKDTVGLVSTPHLNPTHQELVDAVQTTLLDVGIPGEKILMAQGDPAKVKTCTVLISLPALKAHWLTGIGTVLKNYILYSGNPSNYHQENSAKLGEIWNLPFVKGKTKLVIVDALHPLCDKGPQVDPRYKWGYNGLIVGSDPVAVETICLKIITEKRRALRGESWPLSPPPLCVEAADKIYKLGTSKMEEIKLKNFGWTQDLLL